DSAHWLDWYHQTNQRMMRFWGTNWYGLSPDQALDYFDQNGVVVRRSGMLDGEAIGYFAIETDPEIKQLTHREIKLDLLQNWRDQVVAQVKGERNHPSVMLWSIENEWLYINCINLYGGLMDAFEAQEKKTSDAVLAVDPTRLTMSDGGGAGKDDSLPVHGNHYVFGDRGFSAYPDLAYQTNPDGGGRGRWVWDQKRPRFLGEDFFANGVNPFDYAYFGGEVTFQGKAQSRPAAGLITRMLTEGYRWAHYSAFHLWEGPSSAVHYAESNAPRAIFCREWDWTFGSGQKVARTLGLFNDTHDDSPITFTWALTVDGKKIDGETKAYRVGPGTDDRIHMILTLPTVAARAEGELSFSLAVQGREVFHDAKPISVLNTPATGAKPTALANLTAPQLLVYDPFGSVGAFLKAGAIPFTALSDLKSLPSAGRVLIVGKDALTPAESTSSALAAYASEGRAVIVLEQKNPLKYQALPAEMEPAVNEGRTAFIEDTDHPALAGLQQKDFFTWGPDEVVYHNAYLKPTRGGKSLIQCHDRLQNTALAEIPVGKGLALVSQLEIGARLAANPVAQQLLTNLIAYGVAYKLEYRPVALSLKDAPTLAKVLDAAGVQYTKCEGPLQALSAPGVRVAVIGASAENLKLLADNRAQAQAFTQGGGWIVFNGLTPQGLSDYNRIVGFDHMIRPFRRERVTFPP
ncbi:MAG TPA: glycoside hydrolase family 2 TIM barrel-domain containing protein, partial [Chthonomonadaceae bacterium]|nr:glycoside hydrolase family 2 TIM barrel-domain containing protein [Chthonomonadaceae bacterium]